LAQLGDLLALRHHQFAQGVVVLALDQVHVRDQALGLRTDHALHLAAGAIGKACRLVHQPAEGIENRVLRHGLASIGRHAEGANARYVGPAPPLDQSETAKQGPRAFRSRPVPFPDIDPVAFAIGPFAVRWYALAYLAGVFIGALYGWTMLRRRTLWADNRPPFAPGDIWDFAFWAILGIVLGGRLGYVLFYNLPYYAQNPLEAFALWDGGMSFHGGLIGVVVAMALYTRARQGNWLSGLDLLGAI